MSWGSQETLLTTRSAESRPGDLPREGRGSAAAHSPAGGGPPGASRCALGPGLFGRKPRLPLRAGDEGLSLQEQLQALCLAHGDQRKAVSELANRCLFWKSLRTQRDLKMATSLKAHFCLRARVGWARVG